jgi:prepilin peptidase CpaA
MLTWSTLLISPLLLTATVIDLRSSRIPNLICLAIFLSGLILHSLYSGFSGFAQAMGGCLIGFMAFIPLYALKGMGAGDVKLMAAIGTHLGPFTEFKAVLATLAFGGLIALAVLLIRGQLFSWLTRYFQMLATFLRTRQLIYIPPAKNSAANQRFPYALAISLGTGYVIYQQHLNNPQQLQVLLSYLG